MTDDFIAQQRQWAELCREWRAKQEAALHCPLFEDPSLVVERLQEWQRLRAAENEVRDRMDAFIAKLAKA